MAREKEYFSIRYCFAGEENKISPALDNYAQNLTDLSDVNKVLELYDIKLFFDKHPTVYGWSEEDYEKYKVIAANAIKEVKAFFDALTQDNIVETYNSCDVSFWEDFWVFFYKFKVYERISADKFREISEGLKMSPHKMLENKSFVKYFSHQILDQLLEPEFGAVFLIDYFLVERKLKQKYYLPSDITPEQIYRTVESYVGASEHVNANALDLIINSKPIDAKLFPIDDKLRYKAKKRYKKFWEDNSVSMISSETGINVSFALDNPDVDLKFEDNCLVAQYNSLWIEQNQDYPTILNNFIYLFGYVDKYMRCTLTNVTHKRGIIEDLFSTQGNGMYRRGHSFEIMNTLANAQMNCYMNVLNGFDIYLEEVCKWFFEEYIKNEFDAEGFICSFPKRDNTILDKCKLISSAMDGALKQYKLFVEDGQIDRELYEMSSTPFLFKDLPSFVKNKYAYVDDKELVREMKDLFSNQSALSYIEKTKSEYATLTELILKERLNVNDFHKYQMAEIEWLLEKGSLFIDSDIIRLNMERVAVLWQFFDTGYICLQHYRSNCLRQMIIDKKIKVSGSLLAEPEYQYIDYILNKREYSNGLDLRNRYIHDSNSTNENMQYHDYSILMKVMIILIIKINDEFCIRDKMMKGEGDFYEL